MLISWLSTQREAGYFAGDKFPCHIGTSRTTEGFLKVLVTTSAGMSPNLPRPGELLFHDFRPAARLDVQKAQPLKLLQVSPCSELASGLPVSILLG